MWYLISKEDEEKIKLTLQAAIELVDERCGETGCMCDMRENLCSQFYQDGLHILETGIHKTNAVPSDYTT